MKKLTVLALMFAALAFLGTLGSAATAAASTISTGPNSGGLVSPPTTSPYSGSIDFTPRYELTGGDLSAWGTNIEIFGGTSGSDPLHFLMYDEQNVLEELLLDWDYFSQFKAPTLTLTAAQTLFIDGTLDLSGTSGGTMAFFVGQSFFIGENGVLIASGSGDGAGDPSDWLTPIPPSSLPDGGTLTPVPLPASILFLLAPLAGLVGLRRRT